MPVFEIDLEAKDAALQLLAIMDWPHDETKRKHFLVTAAAQSMQKVEDDIPSAADEFVDVLMREAQAAGLSIDPVALKAKAREHVAAAISSVQAEITNDLFRPSGGFGGVAAAGGSDAILTSAMDNGGKFGRACGELLAYIVMMDKHHPDLRPSIRLATHIMIEDAKNVRDIPADRDRREMWQTWGCVAHLWAAVALVKLATGPGVHRVPLKQVISNARWLADFAVSFRPIRAQTTLLQEDEIVRVNPDLPSVEPDIPPLRKKWLHVARNYTL